MAAWIILLVVLWTAFFVARAYESGAFRAYVAELRLRWRSAGVPARALGILLLICCALEGGSKGVTPVGRLFRLLFWQPEVAWVLEAESSQVASSSAAVAAAAAALDAVDAAPAADTIATLSFDWHADDRLPYHDRQNVLAWTAWVAPTNINGTLYEDHYVAFNGAASTNPAVILIEYARTLDDGSVERETARVVTNSYPQTSVVTLPSGVHTCYWFRCAVPTVYTNAVRDWNGEALFGAPVGSGYGFDLLGTLVVDDGDSVWAGASTNIVIGATTNRFANGINITED